MLQWIKNIQNGFGKMITPGVCVYTGQWDDGVRQDDRAVVEYDNGERYEGAFVKDRRHGAARWTDSKGQLFVGRYVNDEKDLSKWHGRVLHDNGTGAAVCPAASLARASESGRVCGVLACLHRGRVCRRDERRAALWGGRAHAR
jgi:hypothetical protein